MGIRAGLRRLAKLLLWPVRVMARALEVPGTFAYLPKFQSEAELMDQYHRALWYLPENSGCVVGMYVDRQVNSDHQGIRATVPDCMQEPPSSGKNIRIFHSWMSFVIYLLRVQFVLVWNIKSTHWAVKWACRLIRKPWIEIDQDRVECVEDAHYAALLSRVLSDSEKLARRHEYQERLHNVVRELSPQSKAYVFGTGPSLQRATEFDLSDGIRIVCNSVVKNKSLLSHIKPHFIVALDWVCHFGVSKYAATFRRDLLLALDLTKAYFVLPEEVEPLMRVHYPQLMSRSIAIPFGKSIVLSLLDDFARISARSVLSICMLPLATTFAHTVFILGCDGRQPGTDQEDFWAHARSSQYIDLVDTQHQCHPTYANRRELKDSYRHHIDYLQEIINAGEKEGFHYICLAPSAIPALAARQSQEEMHESHK